MKKIISLLCALTLIGSAVLTPISANADCITVQEVNAYAEEYYSEWPDREAKHDKVTENGLVFNVYDGYAFLTECEDTDITEIAIPDKINDIDVIGIDGTPFGYCRKLESITLPDTMKYFLWMNLVTPVTKLDSGEEPVPTVKEIKVSETNPYYTVSDGLLFTKDMKTVVGCPPALGYDFSKLPEETETIGVYAFFANTVIENAVIPETIKKIQLNSFKGCSALKSVTLPESITEVQSDTFAFCPALSEVKFGGEITAIGAGAFAYCESLKEFEIPDTVTYIGMNAFENSACIEDVDNVYYVGKWCVGGKKKKLINVTLRDGTVGISEMALILADRIEKFECPDTLKYTGKLCYQASRGELTQIIFRGPTLKEDAFAGVKKLKDIYIYDKNCDIFDSEKTIPAKWKYKKDDTDYDALIKQEEKESQNHSSSSSSKTVYVAVNTQLIDLDEENEENSVLPEVVPYADSKVIASDEDSKYIISDIDTESEVTEGDTVIHGYEGSTAEEYAKKYNRKFEVIGEICYDTSVEHEKFTDGDFEYMTDGKYAWLNSCINKDIKEAVIPETVKDMVVAGTTMNEVFDGCTKLEKLTVNSHISPYSLWNIGTQDCPLKAYDISPDTPYPCTISEGAVYSTDMETVIRVPNGVEGEFKIPESVSVIDSLAFRDCTKMTSVVMGDNIKRINYGAFDGCTSLKAVKLPNSLEYIGTLAFPENAYTAEKDGVHYVDTWAVDSECTDDAKIEILDGTVGLANMLFYMDTIDTLVIPASVKYYPEEQQGISASVLKIWSDDISYDSTNQFYMKITGKNYYFYNKDCKIPEDLFLKKETEEIVIHGYFDSTAEAFAEKAGVKFESMDYIYIHEPFKNISLNKARIQKIEESESGIQITVKDVKVPFVISKDSEIAAGLAEHPLYVGDTVSGIVKVDADGKTVLGIDLNADSLGGDVNCDNDVDMADAVLIMQALANPDKYGENGSDENHLTALGRTNADIEGDEDGMTNRDALAIQKRLLHIK